ncbi:MAG: Radical domain protein [Deltaproteobacteria bacterium]|nr:Radical domain protein [Deltaproteobacteria bacterium]
MKNEARCRLCNLSANPVSKEIGICANCLKAKHNEALPFVMKAHRKSRTAHRLPETPPQEKDGVPCSLCVNECRIPEGGLGYCGLRRNDGGKITGISAEEGKLSWYFDPLPTNCVAHWVCPGGIGAGFPKYAHCAGPERGYKNLAVFFHACTFNCLYCQNWHFREETFKARTISLSRLVSDVDERTSCICYFGGDPTAQLPFSLAASRRALAEKKKKILRICWETNGSMHPGLLDGMIRISLESGGCIKFDLKAWDENLHKALTGITNRRTLENFQRAGEKSRARPVPPLVIASTLLVPGYVEEEEVRSLARFIVSINPEIPYGLLAFYPHFYMSDLPFLSRSTADKCLRAAREEGVRNVRLGNIHLLR